MSDQVIRYGIFVIAIAMAALQNQFGRRRRDFPVPESRIENIYLRLLPAALLGMAFYMFMACDTTNDPFRLWKRVYLISVLWMTAYIDYKSHLIWNEYILASLGMYGVFVILEIILNRSDALTCIAAEVLGAMIMAAFGFVLRFISRRGIGMGDIKLFMILPLFLGAAGAMEALLYAMVVLFVQACFCLLTGRKNRKDVLPFAPAIMVGVFVQIVSSAM